MYRTNDPRFRRRLNEIGQTLENANETAQSGIYIFGQTYIKPCFESIGTCFADCVDASCPTLNQQNRDRLRRQRGRARSGGRAELSFDFYDDWDEDENDGLLGWNNDEFDRVIAGSGGYGTVTDTQPGRRRGMNYPKARRRSNQDIINDPTVIPGSSLFGKLFGGKSLKYKPSAAGLQEHPGARRLGRDRTEGEALLDDSEPSENGGTWRRTNRNRSGTAGSRETQDSFSSRGDIFPSDDEDDAVPLDDEFAMVLERRATNSGNASGPETENSSERTGARKKGKRPSAASSRRTFSSKSARSDSSNQPSRTSSHTALPAQSHEAESPAVLTLIELQHEDVEVAEQEEAEVERKRSNAHRLAAERGLVSGQHSSSASPSEPSQLPTPTATDDEDEEPQLQGSNIATESTK
ncbi:hypothetical protein AMS68_005574 [Peltaster fructicola]|uniref:Uncharacterized protein n=1 Tax=Peltaster fructicola TaxID=286661 RepID=A0A6H0XZ80_9PEZI|nr:hypothetical protein AMS68_005574 [Peltaster fructicola]